MSRPLEEEGGEGLAVEVHFCSFQLVSKGSSQHVEAFSSILCFPV